MTAMLMPSVNSYFAIYTLMDPAGDYPHASANWDLHATATDKSLAMSHAKMLALQPGVGEVHVKRVEENLASGLVSVRNIKSWKRGQFGAKKIYIGALGACSILAVFSLIF